MRFFQGGVMLLAMGLSLSVQAKKQDDIQLTDAQVIALAQKIEADPLNQDAELIRAVLLGWEDGNKTIEDVVCMGIVIDPEAPAFGEVFVPYVMGSAVNQLRDPAMKGNLAANQKAAVNGMLNAYEVVVAAQPKKRDARLDDWLEQRRQGSLDATVAPLVATCAGA